MPFIPNAFSLPRVCLRQVSSNDFKLLLEVVKKIQKEKQPFVRLEMKKEDLLKMFDVCPYPRPAPKIDCSLTHKVGLKEGLF